MLTNEVFDAFELLLEEIEKVVDTLQERIDGYNLGKQFDRAGRLLNIANEIVDFRQEVVDLQRLWKKKVYRISLNGRSKSRKNGVKKLRRKLKRGLRTPQEEYRIPILSSLVELGGSGEVKEVLKLVGEKMRDILNEYDYQRLSTGEVRWENSAKWCRHTLVKEGLLRAGSKRGVWEITEKGREYLEKLKSDGDDSGESSDEG